MQASTVRTADEIELHDIPLLSTALYNWLYYSNTALRPFSSMQVTFFVVKSFIHRLIGYLNQFLESHIIFETDCTDEFSI